jgi:hypothetical protein
MSVTFDLRGTAEVKAMLERHSGKALANRMRRAVRAGGNEFKKSLASTARAEPTGNLPDSFQKIGLKVSSSMRRGGVPTAIVRPKSPLFNIFEPGAGAHEISGGAMGGPAGSRFRKRAFFARGTVRHPGMRARPILHSAFADREPEARDAVARVLFEAD